MFIELTEILRCPRPHDASYMICVPITMAGRQVIRGGVSCPVCQSDFPILGGVVYFTQPRDAVVGATQLTVDAAATFLGIDGPGGYVLLVGSAGLLALDLSERLTGSHFVLINPPMGVSPADRVSILRTDAVIPLKQPSVRGALVGQEAAAEPWLTEAAAVVLPGLRIVVEREDAGVAGVIELARGAGVFVGERRAR